MIKHLPPSLTISSIMNNMYYVFIFRQLKKKGKQRFLTHPHVHLKNQ